MNRNAPIFPPNAQSIRKRLEPYTEYIYERLDVWTCEQSAQVVSGIDPDGFNQNDADNFEALCKILNACAIAHTISPIEKSEGIFYLDPHDVIEWAIVEGYQLPKYVSGWYEEECAKLFGFGLGQEDDETKSTLKPRKGHYKERDEFAIKLVLTNSELLAMRPKEIKEKLQQLNKSLFIAGYADWWREQPVFPKGMAGRIPK
jgi:hypothetical protein